MSHTHETEYKLPNGREVTLEVTWEDRDESVGIMGLQITGAKAWDENGDVELSEFEFEVIAQDQRLYEAIEDRITRSFEDQQAGDRP